MDTETEMYYVHLRSIRSSIAALALAILSVPLIMRNEFGFPILLLTLSIVLFSFLQTLLKI